MTTISNKSRAGLWARRIAILGAAAAVTLGFGGCQDQKIKTLENDLQATRNENETLKSQLAQQNAGGTTAYPADGGGGGARAKTGGGEVVITLSGDVLFDSGKTTLKPTAKTELNKVASELNGKYASHRVRIEGYTDSDPIKKSKFASNEALSEARAEAVEQYLASHGVDAGRMSTVGKGSAKPQATKAKSRRVEIHVLGG